MRCHRIFGCDPIWSLTILLMSADTFELQITFMLTGESWREGWLVRGGVECAGGQVDIYYTELSHTAAQLSDKYKYKRQLSDKYKYKRQLSDKYKYKRKLSDKYKRQGRRPVLSTALSSIKLHWYHRSDPTAVTQDHFYRINVTKRNSKLQFVTMQCFLTYL